MRGISFITKYRLEIANFFVGAVVLSFELAAARIAAPYVGSTIYTWTGIIGVILAALAVGYGLGGWLADKRKKVEDVVLLVCAGAASILLVSLVKDWALTHISQNSLSIQWQSLLASILLFSIPTLLLGMVPPYLVRLNISSVASSGFSAARINAAGTFGSLAGTFLTGYFLFSYVGTRNILSFLAICLILASFVISTSHYLILRVGILLGAGLFLAASPHARVAGLYKDIDTRYSRILIVDRVYMQQPVRILKTDRLGSQSGVNLGGDKNLVFRYIRAFAYAAELNQNTKNFLIIGGGAFTFPEYLAAANATKHVDVVEIDDQLESISKKYFGFNKPSNLEIKAADGRQFLNTNHEKYGIVFVDAFNQLTPPFQLFTQEGVQRIKGSLEKNGVVVANVASPASGKNSEMARAIYKTYSSVFKNVELFQVYPHNTEKNQNLLLVASDKTLDVFATNAAKTNSEAYEIFSHRLINEQLAYGQLLTDDFAPVERFTNKF